MVHNGLVTTGVPGEPQQQALASAGGRIWAIGSDDEVRALIGPSTTVVDARGALVIPGLIDSHTHVVRAGLTWTERLDWSSVTSIPAALASISTLATTIPAGSWIMVVGGWHPSRLTEGRSPTVAELTAAAPDHPVYVQLLYEEAWVNQAALQALNLDRDSADPPGGTFERTPEGDLTGNLQGGGAFAHCLQAAAEPPFETRVASSAAFFSQLTGLGLTGTIDPGGFGMSPETYRPLYELWRRQQLPLRMRLFLMPSSPGNELEQIRDFVRYLNPGFGDDMLRLVGLGEIPLFASWDAEGVRPFRIAPDAKRLLKEIVLLLARNRWPLHQHAIFDSTIGDVLDVWEDVNREVPITDRRFAFAHAEPVGDENLSRIRALGAGIAVQNRMLFRAADSAELWGEDVLRRSPPLRRILDLGIPLGAGTDGTAVSPYNPWWSMWWLTSGRSIDGAPPRAAEHRLSREEALTAYTRGSAWFSHDDDSRGTLAVGAQADLAVLSEDYFAIDEDAIPSLRSVLTVVDGRIVHADDGPDLNQGDATG